MRRDAARVVLASAAGGLLAAAIVVPVGGSASPSRSPLATNLSRASAPRCFGAASRDPEHPCRNRALRLSVVPTPGIAQITPNEPCTQVQVAPDVCVLGATPEQATATVALVGDSHAEHWRAALATIARSRGWRLYSTTRSNCPLSTASPVLSEVPRSVRKAQRYKCWRFKRNVFAWLRSHPEITTVFVSQHSRAAEVLVRPGRNEFAARVRAHVHAWRRLPRRIEHLVVIRDVPYMKVTTLTCVRRAIAARRPADPRCALPRRESLERDAGAVAAARMNPRRVHLLDFTPFMCGPRLCFSVVGGVLVHVDHGHLTRLFSSTLGPFVARAFDRAVTAGG